MVKWFELCLDIAQWDGLVRGTVLDGGSGYVWCLVAGVWLGKVIF